MSGQPTVHLEWGTVGAQLLGATCRVVVVCDVLSFSTAVSVATARGVEVWPHDYAEPAAARERAQQLGAVLAATRGEPGSLSPASLVGLAAGSRVLLPSPNGAAACLSAARAGAVVAVGCLRNAPTVARWLSASVGAGLDGDVGLLAAGERWPDGSLRPAYEDWVGAGAIAAAVQGFRLTPEAEAAALAAPRRRSLREVASGVELVERGFGADVDLAEDYGADDAVPVLDPMTQAFAIGPATQAFDIG
jgi:2-phosphosulfolactate phosphatase